MHQEASISAWSRKTRVSSKDIDTWSTNHLPPSKFLKIFKTYIIGNLRNRTALKISGLK